MKKSLAIALTIFPFGIGCWLAMLLAHELGHIAAAMVTGGQITYVDVYPGRISSTLVSPNPMPSIVLWCGFLSGWLIPQAVAWLSAWTGWFVLPTRIWAGFCWLVGGVYLAVGGVERFADTAMLVKQGWSLWMLLPTGVSVAGLGYAISRDAWPKMLCKLEEEPLPGQAIAFCWMALAAWIGFQYSLASALDQMVEI